MSLLDDVSIVVTPNGYKAGTLYGVLPVPTEGAEEVSDGNFLLTGTQAENTTGTYWTTGTGTTISGGNGNFSNATGVSLYQDIGIQSGIVKVTFTVTNYASGTLNVYSGGNQSAGTINVVANALETYTAYVNRSGGNVNIIFGSSDSFTGSISNVSVKEYTSADMDVTRATAATRVDENGLVNYAEVIGDSILTGNNSNFDTGIGSWITYIGGSLAHDTDKLEVTLLATGSGARINTNSLISGGQIGKTFKIRAKIWQGTTTATSLNVYLGSVQDVITISSTPTYFEVELTPTSTAYLTIYRGSSSGGTFFIDDVTVKEVTRDNVPRIDYTGGGCPHILAEPQRTNLIPYSEDFTVGNWAKTRCTVTSNQAISPDGTLNADLMTSTDDDARLGDQVGSSGAEYTQSIYVKSAQVSDVNCQIDFAGLNTVTFTANQQWQRVETTLTDTSQSPRLRLRILNSGNSIYVWGGQVEQGSYATSYIPTSGSIVTRNQDIFSRDGISSLINSTEGVLFVEMAALSDDITRRAITLSDGTTNNRIVLRYKDSSSTIESFIVVANNLYGLISENSYTITNFLKIAYKWKAGDFALWINGVEVDTSADATSFGADVLTQMQFNDGDGAGNEYFGKVKQLQVYDTALTDNQLIQLTGEAGTHFFESYSEMAETLTYTIQ